MSLLPYFIGPAEFYHYASTSLGEIAWLSESEYRNNSLARRASYSYLNEIVEGASKLVEQRLKTKNRKPEGSYRKRFAAAGREKILPVEFAVLLEELAVLRNLATHENPKVNAELQVFPLLIDMSAIGFALSEFLVAEENSDLGLIVVDRVYLVNRVSKKFQNSPEHRKKEQLMEVITRYDRRLPSRII